MNEDYLDSTYIQDNTLNPNIFQPIILEDEDDKELTQDEFDKIAKESKKDSVDRVKKSKRIADISKITSLQPYEYPEITIGKEQVASPTGQGVVEVDKKEKVNVDKMEEIITDVSSVYKSSFNNLLSDSFKKLQNMSEDPTNNKETLDAIHEKVYSQIKEKHPGLSKDDFLKITDRGLFSDVLNNAASDYKNNDDTENLSNAQSIDEDFYKNVVL